ncbi:L2 capsid protein [Bos taurus papillomavirus 19]|uniref:Minor capsid protein L2 n=1 Tax=Bos taurus papillomavirus 19 TaxID=1887217 RepID=A0A1B2K229_9PAPI|nr:L2 capsid protein [Bos taurus papillomavirus 19]ANZ90254.1 L2 capsid protein [Bos taurus papillomavirus 19]
MTLRRRKRDSAENLWRHCQATGAECPPDVINKYTENTLADRLSKIFASILYLGGLAIGTGKGSGGNLGYRPLGEPVGPPRVGPGGTVIRPNVVVDAVGPADLIPLDSLNPDSSVIPLLRGTPEGSEVGLETPDILGESDPASDVTITTGNTVTLGEDTPAILEVTPVQPEEAVPPPAKRPRVSAQEFLNATYDPSIFSTEPVTLSTTGTASNSVTVDFGLPSTEIGQVFEEIELDEFTPLTRSPQASTPADESYGLFSRIREFYNRRIRQVEITSPTFLRRPQAYIDFAYGVDNPAFDPDVSREFLEDLAELENVTAAPHSDFQDIVRLNRQVFQEGEGGRLRVSRIGNRGTISTRSGLLIGERVHFYQDLSSIQQSDGIELAPLGSFTGEATVVTGTEEGAFVDASSSFDYEGTGIEDVLLDNYEESFERSQLVIGTRRSSNIVPMDFYRGEIRPFVQDLTEGWFYGPPEIGNDENTPIYIDWSPLEPGSRGPDLIINLYGNDYSLHPSYLLRRRRKRKRFHVL